MTVLRTGRRPVTTRTHLAELALALFDARGFERTTVDDLAAEAGIGRRTFFRYYASKNDVVWGDFDAGLAALHDRLAATPPEVALFEALLQAVLDFNRLDAHAVAGHRRRMELILHVPALQAHSTLRYAAWRAVVAQFVADRRGERVDAAVPQLVAHTLLAATVAGYEQWLARPGSELEPLLEQSLRRLGAGLEALGS
jgi:mycofactocin system transcriptional regulator